jgi:hypothetical protein
MNSEMLKSGIVVLIGKEKLNVADVVVAVGLEVVGCCWSTDSWDGERKLMWRDWDWDRDRDNLPLEPN